MFDDINFNGPDYLSANAALCQVYLPDLFFYKPDAFKFCITHGEGALVYEFLNMIMFQMHKHGFDETPFMYLKYVIKKDEERHLHAYVFEIPNAKKEIDCNFLALCFRENDCFVYLSELYEGLFGEEGHFGLCGRDAERNHYNYGSIVEDIRTFDDMWDAIIKVNS